MAFAAGHITFEPPAVPAPSRALGVTFRLSTVTNKKGSLILFPAGPGQEHPYRRFAVYMTLTRAGGYSAGDLGQLVVAGERLIGMMTHGSAGGTRLDERTGSVYVFAVARDDLAPAVQKIRWTGRAAGVVMGSAPAFEPGFELTVTSLAGAVADDGTLTKRATFASLLEALGTGPQGGPAAPAADGD